MSRRTPSLSPASRASDKKRRQRPPVQSGPSGPSGQREKSGKDVPDATRRTPKGGKGGPPAQPGKASPGRKDKAPATPAPTGRGASDKAPAHKPFGARPDARPGTRPGGYPPTRPPMPLASPWPRPVPLFPPLGADIRAALECLPEALHKVWPLNTAHRRSLPDDVAALSRLLTTERRDLRRPYWSSPAFVSAYLYYFLPWNLLRLSRLLTALPLPDPRALAPEGGEALLLDAGSGPLSLPLALWLARPQWRDAPVRVLALDSAARLPELGRALFEAWGACLGWKTWPVRTAQGPLESLPRHVAPLLTGPVRRRPWLLTAANVLNELKPGRKAVGGWHGRDEDMEAPYDADGADSTALEEDGQRSGGPLAQRLDSLLDAFAPLLFRGRESHAGGEASPDPALLFVEPGTRLGGTTIMRLRTQALEGGLAALAPCPHNAPCPLLTGQGGRTWCHFTFDSQDAPGWLLRLSTEAGLSKSGLSLAPLLLGPGQEDSAPEQEEMPARVLSAPFAVPGLMGRARYACTGRGLALLEDAESLHAGGLLPVRIAADAPRDAKSRARIVRRPRHSPGRP